MRSSAIVPCEGRLIQTAQNLATQRQPNIIIKYFYFYLFYLDYLDLYVFLNCHCYMHLLMELFHLYTL